MVRSDILCMAAGSDTHNTTVFLEANVHVLGNQVEGQPHVREWAMKTNSCAKFNAFFSDTKIIFDGCFRCGVRISGGDFLFHLFVPLVGLINAVRAGTVVKVDTRKEVNTNPYAQALQPGGALPPKRYAA